MAIDRLAAKRVPDVIDGIVPSGIMTLAVADDVATAEALWAHGRACVRARELFLGSVRTRAGAFELLRPEAGAPHGLRPTVMYMATTMVWLDLTHLDDVDAIDARFHELRTVFDRMANDHWHAVQPAFVVAIPDVFECGPFGAFDLARSFFGELALGAVYVEALGEDAPSVVLRARERTVSCHLDEAGGFSCAEGGGPG